MPYLLNKRFDILFFQLSGLLCLLLLIPYGYWGAAVVIPIYNIYLIFFGLPHNYMTWSTVFPKQARKTIAMRHAVIYPGIICLLICLTLPFVQGNERNIVLTIITIASLWHSYRQHHGICKLYDAVQARKTEDPSIFADRKWLDRFFALSVWLIVVWAFTHPEIKYLLSDDEYYMLLYPQVPQNVFYGYCGVTVVAGFIAVKKVVWDRSRQGKFIPWPQINLMAVAVATYIVPYFFIPISAMPLAVAIATMYHNIQYFGFVWAFERTRSEEWQRTLPQKNIPMASNLVLKGKWKTWFAMALVYSFLVTGIYLIAPTTFGLFLIYFVALAHYIIDGFIWKRKNNLFVSHFVKRLASEPISIHEDISIPGQVDGKPTEATT